MKIDLILGLQWGDEGKGKIVDFLTNDYNIIARFQGGPNAGHTLEFDGIKHVLHTIPSGIFNAGVTNLIGNGVVIDPWALLDEIKDIKKQGIDVNPENFMIAESSSLIRPFQQEMDEIREDAAGKEKIGTTRRGIGPCYEDKVSRKGIRFLDLQNIDIFQKKLTQKQKNLLIY